MKQVDGDTFFFIGLDLTLGYFSPAGGSVSCLWNSDCAFSLVVHWFFSVPKIHILTNEGFMTFNLTGRVVML